MTAVPAETKAIIKENNSFAYGSFFENFYIMVSTTNFKQEIKLELSKSIEGSLAMIQNQGGQNIVLDQEDFETKGRIKGKKGFGTFVMTDPIQKKTSKLYFDIIVFDAEGSLEQIVLIRNESDAYAKQIMDRIINSIELKTNKE